MLNVTVERIPLSIIEHIFLLYPLVGIRDHAAAIP